MYNHDCDSWYHDATVKPCIFGSSDSKNTVVLIGDSIAAQWFVAIPEIFTQPDWRVIVLTKSSCPMVDVDFYYERIGKKYHVCKQWRDDSIDWINQKDIDVVIVGSASTYHFTEDQWVSGSERVLRQLALVKKEILLVPGTPSLGFDGPGCAFIKNIETGDIENCKAKGGFRSVEAITGYLSSAADRIDDVNIVDLNDIVCSSDFCYAQTIDKKLVFRDSQHLTDDFVLDQLPVIKSRMGEVLKSLNSRS